MMDTADKLLMVLTDKPQSRALLARKLGCSDRALRRAVRELRKEGHTVCSDSEMGGYWLGTDEETKRLVKELEHRGLDLLETARKIKARQLDGQVRIGGM